MLANSQLLALQMKESLVAGAQTIVGCMEGLALRFSVHLIPMSSVPTRLLHLKSCRMAPM